MDLAAGSADPAAGDADPAQTASPIILSRHRESGDGPPPILIPTAPEVVCGAGSLRRASRWADPTGGRPASSADNFTTQWQRHTNQNLSASGAFALTNINNSRIRALAGDDAISRVPSMEDAKLVVEVQAILDGVPARQDADHVPAVISHTPLDVLQRGVMEVINGTGTLVLDNRMYDLLWRYEMGGSGPLRDVLPAPYRASSAVGTLYLEEDDDCSLLVTFSNGEPPLTQEEIKDYFAETLC